MNVSILNRPARRAQGRPPGGLFSVTTGEVMGLGPRVRQHLSGRMAREREAMAHLALSTGRTVPLEVVTRLDQALSAIDAPAAVAIPGRRSTHPLLYALGPLPIVRHIGLAILSLFLLLGIALSEEVNVVNMGISMQTLAGYPLFVKEVYLVSAASLGSCFQNLQKINIVISDGTYDPKFQSTYWTTASTTPSRGRLSERLTTAADLVNLQYGLACNQDADEIRRRLDGLIQRITLKAG